MAFKSTRIVCQTRRAAALWKPSSTQAPDWLNRTTDRQDSPELGSQAYEVVRCGGTSLLTQLLCTHRVITVEIKSRIRGFPWNLTRFRKVFGDDRVPSKEVEGNK